VWLEGALAWQSVFFREQDRNSKKLPFKGLLYVWSLF